MIRSRVFAIVHRYGDRVTSGRAGSGVTGAPLARVPRRVRAEGGANRATHCGPRHRERVALRIGSQRADLNRTAHVNVLRHVDDLHRRRPIGRRRWRDIGVAVAFLVRRRGVVTAVDDRDVRTVAVDLDDGAHRVVPVVRPTHGLAVLLGGVGLRHANSVGVHDLAGLTLHVHHHAHTRGVLDLAGGALVGRRRRDHGDPGALQLDGGLELGVDLLLVLDLGRTGEGSLDRGLEPAFDLRRRRTRDLLIGTGTDDRPLGGDLLVHPNAKNLANLHLVDDRRAAVAEARVTAPDHDMNDDSGPLVADADRLDADGALVLGDAAATGLRTVVRVARGLAPARRRVVARVVGADTGLPSDLRPVGRVHVGVLQYGVGGGAGR